MRFNCCGDTNYIHHSWLRYVSGIKRSPSGASRRRASHFILYTYLSVVMYVILNTRIVTCYKDGHYCATCDFESIDRLFIYVKTKHVLLTPSQPRRWHSVTVGLPTFVCAERNSESKPYMYQCISRICRYRILRRTNGLVSQEVEKTCQVLVLARNVNSKRKS